VHPKAPLIFEQLGNITQTCNSVSRCLDTALMSSHSGLSALLRVLHQFQSMKQSLGHILGIFSLVRYFKSKKTLMFSVKEFEKFNNNSSNSRYWVIAALLIPFAIHYISLLASTADKVQQLPHTKSKQERLDFARARNAFQAKNKKELSLQCNDLIAVISRDNDDWWYGRLKNGKMGYFPANHVELIKKN
jgi:peroxin-13